MESSPAAPAPPAPAGAAGELVYDGEGWLEGRTVRTRCRVSGSGYEVAIEGTHRYWVASDGGSIVELAAPEGEDDSTVVLGPPLVLALALRGVYYLHASAIARESRPGVVALCGRSGAGKSTLAAAAHTTDGLRRCADDLFAVPADDLGSALLHVPQLKLAAAEQPGRNLPERLPLRAILWLDTPATDDAPRLRPRHGAGAVSRIVASTVAARLFPPQVAARHLAFCAALAGVVPVADLRYPRRRELIPEVLALASSWPG